MARSRLLAVAALAALVLGPVACSGASPLDHKAPDAPGQNSNEDRRAASTAASAGIPQLPRGGRVLFPRNRVVAYYGEGFPKGIGLLPVADLDGAASRLAAQAAPYAKYGRPVLPAFELIATNAVHQPGPDGSYSLKLDDDTVQRYLDAARRHQLLLILDFQPGTQEFLPQVKRYEKFLTQPDVAVGLDPEWRTPGSRPYAGTGHSSANEINQVSHYLADLTRQYDLPQKLLVIHQFTRQMVPDRQRVTAPKELAVVFHMDGVGPPGLKTGGYNTLQMQSPFRDGFKVFPVLDKPAMTPAQVMALSPAPEVITYQ